MIFGDCVKVKALCLGAANPARRAAYSQYSFFFIFIFLARFDFPFTMM
jgi:hypothetical protein|tara:strand:- start:117 stop:260 length:144 start_codon:yes stop_codon:yes gene_type:complete